MEEGIENINKRDVAWSYAASLFMVGAGLILLPFILSHMAEETVGIWNIFQAITSLILLLDFGFRPAFARNVSYIFSGVKSLQKEGVAELEGNGEIDYALLKGTLKAMQRFYRMIALLVFVLLATAGTAYFVYILGKYSGDHTDATIAWVLLIAINCYNLYTFYYDALLLGKGYVKRSQQITIIGQSIYLLVAIGLIYAGCGLTAIVCAQVLSTLVRRFMMYRTFYTKSIVEKLKEVETEDYKGILKAICPNAIKVGLTTLGGFLVTKSAIFIGTAYVGLEAIASYGITLQVCDILCRCGQVYYQSFVPKLAQYRTLRDYQSLIKAYKYSILTLIVIFVAGGLAFVFLGNWALDIIHSKTYFLPTGMLCVALIINFLEQNHYIAAGFIQADNRIPFFIPSLASGAATVILLVVFVSPKMLNMGIWGMILAGGIAQLAYQNWKWPSMLIKEFKQNININN